MEEKILGVCRQRNIGRTLFIVAGDLALARRNLLGLANLKAVASQFARDFLKLGTRDDEQRIEFTERGKPAAILVQ